ncbi:4Fe-4S binding protein [Natronospora cellulosivora (SeqCode)]
MKSKNYFIKTNRTFTFFRKYAWVITLFVAIGGQFYPYFGLIVPFIIIALTASSFTKGRFWCGNFCPHGSFFDRLLLPISRNKKIPAIFTSKIVVVIFFLYFLINLSRRFIGVFQNLENVSLFYSVGMIFSNTYLMVLVVGGLLAIFINSRTWCQFCPMGAIQTLSYKLGKLVGVTESKDVKVSVEHSDLCQSCGKCARVCPMQLTPYKDFDGDNNQFDNEKCIKCNTCVENCPVGILHMATADEAKDLREKANLDGFEDSSYYEAEIKSIKELSKDIKEFNIKLIKPNKMNLTPGQFILIKIDKENDVDRAYSISKANQEGTEISITVKKVDYGYGTNIMFSDFSEGDRVEIIGPLGREIRIDYSNKKLMFLANGIGITPFVLGSENSLEYKDLYNFDGEIDLLYGVRYQEDLIYDQLFSDLEKKHSNFNYHKALSREDSSNARKGYITDILKDMDVDKDTVVYICGTRAMADDATKILLNKGLAKEAINYEDFAI